MMTRRMLGLGAAALVVAGCASDAPVAPVQADPALSPRVTPGWQAWVAGFRTRALARGITAQTFDLAFRGAGFVPGVVERDRNQTEFRRTLEDYLAIVAPEDKIAFGTRAFADEAPRMAPIAARYGVPSEVLAAIWGVESYFGTRRGTIPVISATSTLAFDGRRGRFFEAQLLAALRLIQAGDARPDQMVGSWAGAMGHTQMIPETYLANAVDFDGDGQRNIWEDDPVDALASTANFLDRAGWQAGQPWMREVILPAGFAAPSGRTGTRALGAWSAQGVRAATGSLPASGSAALVVPQTGGPAFLLWPNFDRFLRYNPALNYGLGVGYLANRLAGQGPLVGRFPPDANGLTQDDRKALQTGLTRAGFDAGPADGVIGRKTEAAIDAFQRARGLPVTGTPSRDLLQRLS